MEPPNGYKNWLDWCVADGNSRDLYNLQFFDDKPQWGRFVDRQEFREEVKAELADLRTRAGERGT